MFTCPDKEIHSVYLDGELPPRIACDYEAHIALCGKCRAELERMRIVHEVLSKDALLITPSEAFKQKSWEKLSSRLRYSKVVRNTRPSWGALGVQGGFASGFARGVWHVLPAAAAAAVVAVVLPLRLRSSNQSSAIAAGAAASSPERLAPLLTSAPLAGGTLNGAVGSTLPQFDHSPFNGGAINGAGSGAPFIAQMGQNASFGEGYAGGVNGGGFQHGSARPEGLLGVHRRRGVSPQVFGNTAGATGELGIDISSVDMFRPDFEESAEKTINIRISVPGLKGERAYTTISVPVDALNASEE